jgi:3-methylfumaryl-CoA hydratase
MTDPAGWIGRTERAVDRIDPWPAAALSAALGRDDPPEPGSALPPYWHHLYAKLPVPAAATGPDGHWGRGIFQPPADGRRMWAGGRVTWRRPLVVGEPVERLSTVKAVSAKQGRSGPLVFVTTEHRYGGASDVAVVEEQDLVYRAGAATGAPPPAPPSAAWRREWRADPVLLFRYSALTFNGHRIHYDQAYAREVEGYAGLVVHGPLLATLLLDLVRRERPEAVVRSFAFRALAPVLADRPFAVCGVPQGGGARLWVEERGQLRMTAEVTFG